MRLVLRSITLSLAAISFSGCSTLIEQASQKELQKSLANSTCADPYVFRESIAIPLGAPSKILETELALLNASLDEGYKVERSNVTSCQRPGVDTLIIGYQEEGQLDWDEVNETVFVYFVKSDQGEADPNIKCYQKTRQVYQPPIKDGGAGKVLNVSDGRECKYRSS